MAQANAVHSFFVVSKAGGLIYSWFKEPPQTKMNDLLIHASNFHAMHAFATQLCPIVPADGQQPSGMEILEAENFKIQCYRSPPGTLFFVVAELGARGLDELLQQIYRLYADYVLKNPAYSLDQPIREQPIFEHHLSVLLRQSGQ